MEKYKFVTQDSDGEIVLRTTKPIHADSPYEFWDRTGDDDYITLCRPKIEVPDWKSRIVNLQCNGFDIVNGLLESRGLGEGQIV